MSSFLFAPFLIILAQTFFGWESKPQNGTITETAKRVPGILHDDAKEKSFAGQMQTAVRLPFGPNPFQHHINDMSLLKSIKYQKQYQKNLKTLLMDTLDWRIDPVMNSDKNNYASIHMTGDGTIQNLSNFHDRRKLKGC